MAKQYTRKAKVKQADEFVGFWEKAYAASLPYTRPILFTMAGAVAVLIAAWSVDHLLTTTREDATEEFDHAARVAEAELITDANPSKPEDKLPRFKTEKDRLEAALGEVEKLEKDRSSTKVAERALLWKAGALFDLARYPDAEAAYKKFLDSASDNDPLRFLAREGVGLSLESENKLDDAMASYKELEPKGGDFYRDRALYDQARVLMKKGDKKGAEAIYKDILTKVPKTTLKDDIEMRLGLLGATLPPPAPAAAGG